MHFAVTRAHLDFFHQHHYIEFEDLLSQADVQLLSKELTKTHKLQSDNPLSGYDSWRYNPTIKKFVLRREFAEVASSLTKAVPIRIAFDQLFSSSKHSSPPYKTPLPLFEMSCIQGIVCGCILQLSSPSKQNLTETHENFTPIPKQAGSGIFFSADLPLSFDYLLDTPNIVQLMIVYAEDNSLYTYLESDPHTHLLKKLGYVFGDRLKNSTHPILFRG